MTEIQWNKEIVRDYFRYVSQGNIDRMLAYMHPNVSLELPGMYVGGVYQGLSGIRSYFSKASGQFGANVIESIQSLVADGSQVVADVSVMGALPNGAALDLRVLYVFELQDRKIARQSLFFDTEKLAALVGDGAEASAAA